MAEEGETEIDHDRSTYIADWSAYTPNELGGIIRSMCLRDPKRNLVIVEKELHEIKKKRRRELIAANKRKRQEKAERAAAERDNIVTGNEGERVHMTTDGQMSNQASDNVQDKDNQVDETLPRKTSRQPLKSLDPSTAQYQSLKPVAKSASTFEDKLTSIFGAASSFQKQAAQSISIFGGKPASIFGAGSTSQKPVAKSNIITTTAKSLEPRLKTNPKISTPETSLQKTQGSNAKSSSNSNAEKRQPPESGKSKHDIEERIFKKPRKSFKVIARGKNFQCGKCGQDYWTGLNKFGSCYYHDGRCGCKMYEPGCHVGSHAEQVELLDD